MDYENNSEKPANSGYENQSPNKNRSLYDVLGIPKTATEAEIKNAYRRLALKYHPDKNLDKKEEAEVKFKELTAAYETLSDPEERQYYDTFGCSRKSGNVNDFQSADKLFKDLFGKGGLLSDFFDDDDPFDRTMISMMAGMFNPPPRDFKTQHQEKERSYRTPGKHPPKYEATTHTVEENHKSWMNLLAKSLPPNISKRETYMWNLSGKKLTLNIDNMQNGYNIEYLSENETRIWRTVKGEKAPLYSVDCTHSSHGYHPPLDEAETHTEEVNSWYSQLPNYMQRRDTYVWTGRGKTVTLIIKTRKSGQIIKYLLENNQPLWKTVDGQPVSMHPTERKSSTQTLPPQALPQGTMGPSDKAASDILSTQVQSNYVERKLNRIVQFCSKMKNSQHY